MNNDYDKWSQMQDEMNDAVAAAIDGKVFVYYSAYNYQKDNPELPINNLNKVAIRGKVIMTQPYDDFWDGAGVRYVNFNGNVVVESEGKAYESAVLENPTYLELAVLANAMMQVTGDFHHSFFEAVNSTGRVKDDDVKIYEFSMGS